MKNQKKALIGLAGLSIAAMVGFSIVGGQKENVISAFGRLWKDVWFKATFTDLYLSFIWIWLWVVWRERSWLSRILWLMGFLSLGNIAIGAYVLWALLESDKDDVVEILGRKRHG